MLKALSKVNSASKILNSVVKFCLWLYLQLCSCFWMQQMTFMSAPR